jgi:hypothetical protein
MVGITLVLAKNFFDQARGLFVHVPVRRRGHIGALRGVQPDGVHVGVEHQKADQLLAAFDQAEFAGLLD